MTDLEQHERDESDTEAAASPPKLDVPNAPSSTIGVGSTLGIGCLVLVILAVIVLAVLRSRGVAL